MELKKVYNDYPVLRKVPLYCRRTRCGISPSNSPVDWLNSECAFEIKLCSSCNPYVFKLPFSYLESCDHGFICIPGATPRTRRARRRAGPGSRSSSLSSGRRATRQSSSKRSATSSSSGTVPLVNLYHVLFVTCVPQVKCTCICICTKY